MTVDRVRDEFETWAENIHLTHKFLECCKQAGITRVAISMSHESVPASTGYWASRARGSVFQYPSELNYPDWWPAIWWACKQAGISYGCGNGDQHQINANVTAGVYHFRHGVWKKVA